MLPSEVPPVWIVKLERVVDGRTVCGQEVATFDIPARLEHLRDFGLTLDDGKAILAAVQQTVVGEQIAADTQARRTCDGCGSRRHVKDHRQRTIDTVFGRTKVRPPRLVCRRCQTTNSLPRGRSTPEFDELRAMLSAQLPYRPARDLLKKLLPTTDGVAVTTLRNQVFAVAGRTDAERGSTTPVVAAEELVMGLDTAHVRSANRRQCRHHQVLVGHVERGSIRHAFACIQDETAPTAIRAHLDVMGYQPETALTAFTDGAEGLRSLPQKAAGKPIAPLLDHFHIAMRLQHLTQTTRGFQTETYNHERFKAKVARQTERLRWRLWHGRPKGVRKAINYLKHSFANFRIRAKLDGYKHVNDGPRKYWGHLTELDRYIQSNSAMIPNYHRRYHAGQRVSTALVESAVNSLVNHRMNKRGQMRWSAKGAAGLLSVRTAVVNGDLPKTQRHLQAPRQPNVPALRLAA